MNAATMTQEEIRQQGIAALAQQLGPVGMIRFLQQFERVTETTRSSVTNGYRTIWRPSLASLRC